MSLLIHQRGLPNPEITIEERKKDKGHYASKKAKLKIKPSTSAIIASIPHKLTKF